MIIDGHCHIGVSWLGWQRNQIGIERLLEIYDKLGVDKACLNAWQISYDIEAGNKEVYAMTRKYPDRLIGFGIICPRDRQRAMDEAKRCINDYGFRGLKLHSTINHYMADSTLVDPVMDFAESYNLFSHPRMIGVLAERHPQAVLIIGHMGGQAWLEAIEMAKKYPNVYLDTADVLNQVNILPTAIQEVGAERILWGTDSPILNVAVELAKITTADLYAPISQEDKEAILGTNMARLLGLAVN